MPKGVPVRLRRRAYNKINDLLTPMAVDPISTLGVRISTLTARRSSPECTHASAQLRPDRAPSPTQPCPTVRWCPPANRWSPQSRCSSRGPLNLLQPAARGYWTVPLIHPPLSRGDQGSQLRRVIASARGGLRQGVAMSHGTGGGSIVFSPTGRLVHRHFACGKRRRAGGPVCPPPAVQSISSPAHRL
jgi:hypothetical protein